MLVLYPLEPHPKDSVDTPEGNLEIGAVLPRPNGREDSLGGSTFYDRATSQHVYSVYMPDIKR